jgi:hypothetical protein
MHLQSSVTLDTLCGVAYLVSHDGTIVDYSHTTWNRFALNNDAPELVDPENVRGKLLLDFISGEETRALYHRFHELLLSGRRQEISFHYRCDGPGMRRDMFMAITPVKGGNRGGALLYHSITLSEHQRVPIPFLRRMESEAKGDIEPVILSICSYCRSVRFAPEGKQEEWVTPEEYYRRGGPAAGKLSHGICPPCYASLAKPLSGGS